MNMLIRLIVAAFAVAFISGCASKPAPGAVAMNDKDPERIICRNDPPTGSRIPKKTCKSAREWDAIAEASQEIKRNMRRRERPTSTSTVD